MSILSKGIGLVTGASPTVKIGLAVGAFVLLGLAAFGIKQFVDGAFDSAKDAGAAEAVAVGKTVTLEQVGKANDAGNEIRNGLNYSKFCQCVRDAANGPGVCERYRPDKSMPDRPERPCQTGPGS